MATTTENVAEEVQSEEVVSPQEEQAVTGQDTPVDSQETQEENSKEFNFRQLRESNKQLEDRLKKSDEIIEAYTNSQHQLSQTPSIPQEEELGADDLAEGKHLKRLEAKLEKLMYQKELEAVPDKLKGKFEDFDQVVTKENLDKLQKSEPELYRTIRSGTDLFATGVAAYKTLKSLGYIQEQESMTKQKDHVQANHKKPLSAQAIKGQGALHEANAFASGLTPELKKQLQKEMAEAVKSR